MPHGINSRASAAEKAARKAVINERKRARKARNKLIKTLPQITEHHLLSFQLAHFGDDTKPNEWFVDRDRALNFEPEYEQEDDGLGYYDDGVKRTLTDEQIAVFRRKELWQMKRDQESQYQEDLEGQSAGAASPASDVSSLEDELLQYATVQRKQQVHASAPTVPIERIERKPSHSGRSETNSISSDPKKRKRAQEVPYDQRHKRQWEGYIHDHDPVEGSVTHRRLAREMDNQQEDTVELDY